MKRNSLSEAREACRAAFFDGANCAYFAIFEGERDEDGYPKGFHQWELEKRNAWWAGANLGYLKTHPQTTHEEAADG